MNALERLIASRKPAPNALQRLVEAKKAAFVAPKVPEIPKAEPVQSALSPDDEWEAELARRETRVIPMGEAGKPLGGDIAEYDGIQDDVQKFYEASDQAKKLGLKGKEFQDSALKKIAGENTPNYFMLREELQRRGDLPFDKVVSEVPDFYDPEGKAVPIERRTKTAPALPEERYKAVESDIKDYEGAFWGVKDARSVSEQRNIAKRIEATTDPAEKQRLLDLRAELKKRGTYVEEDRLETSEDPKRDKAITEAARPIVDEFKKNIASADSSMGMVDAYDITRGFDNQISAEQDLTKKRAMLEARRQLKEAKYIDDDESSTGKEILASLGTGANMVAKGGNQLARWGVNGLSWLANNSGLPDDIRGAFQNQIEIDRGFLDGISAKLQENAADLEGAREDANPGITARRNNIMAAEGYVDALKKALADPGATLSIIGDSLPMMAAGGVAGKAISSLAGATTAGGMIGGQVAGEALVAGSINAASVREQLMDPAVQEQVKTFPEWGAALAEANGNEKEAMRIIADNAAATTGASSAALTAFFGRLFSGINAQVAGAEVRRGVLPYAKSVGSEALQEAGQEGGDKFSENIGVNEAGFQRDPTEGVAAASGLGTIMGSGMAAGIASPQLLGGTAERDAATLALEADRKRVRDNLAAFDRPRDVARTPSTGDPDLDAGNAMAEDIIASVRGQETELERQDREESDRLRELLPVAPITSVDEQQEAAQVLDGAPEIGSLEEQAQAAAELDAAIADRQAADQGILEAQQGAESGRVEQGAGGDLLLERDDWRDLSRTDTIVGGVGASSSGASGEIGQPTIGNRGIESSVEPTQGDVANDVRTPDDGVVEAPDNPSPTVTFTTEKGSTYELFSDRTTTRNKAARADAGHEGDSGIKERSAKTVFVSVNPAVLSSAGLVGEDGNPVKSRLIIKDGKATLVTWNGAKGRWGVSPSSKDISISDTPIVGSYPLELWSPANDMGDYEAYQKMHAGNKIVSINEQSTDREAVEAPQTVDENLLKMAELLSQEGSTEALPPGDFSDAAAELIPSVESEIGWTERGGNLIRDPETGAVTGRTPWVAKPSILGGLSEFWKGRPEPISEKAAALAIEKFRKGERLAPIERRFVAYAGKYAEQVLEETQAYDEANRAADREPKTFTAPDGTEIRYSKPASKYDGPTMDEINALNDVGTVDVMAEAISAVGEGQFEAETKKTIAQMSNNGKYPISESMAIEATARKIVAMKRRAADPVRYSKPAGLSALERLSSGANQATDQVDGPRYSQPSREVGGLEVDSQGTDSLEDSQGIEVTEVDLSPEEFALLFGRSGSSAASAGATTQADQESAADAWRTKKTDSPWFKRWFGSSKAVDRSGKPRRFYHGTADAFIQQYDPARAGQATGYAPSGLGMWLTADQGLAQQYSQSGKVLDGYVSMQNPLTIRADQLPEFDTVQEYKKYAKGLQAKGYDGILIPSANQAVIFNSNQYKTEDNSGEFSQDPRFKYSKPAESSSNQTKTPEFKRWFGNSKVVDADGNPLIVYHGTDQPIESFDPKRSGASTGAVSAKQGFWFVDRPDVAASYANYAAIDAPVRRKVSDADKAGDRGNWDAYDKLTDEAEALEREISDAPDRGQNVLPVYLRLQNPAIMDAGGELFTTISDQLNAFIRKARASGRDGVIVRNVDDDPRFSNRTGDHFLVFNPSSIKSAIGNSGAFDPRNPDIRYSEQSKPPKGDARKAAEKAWGKRLIDKLVRNRILTFVSRADVRKMNEGKTDPRTIIDERANAFVVDGRAYVINENVSEDAAPGITLHEVGVHYGLEAMVGGEVFKKILADLKSLQKTDERVKEAYARVPKDTLEKYKDEEALGYLVEMDPQHGLIQRIVDAIVTFLKRIGFQNEGLLQESRADEIMRIVRNSLRNAGKPQKAGVVVYSDYDNAYSQPEIGDNFYSAMARSVEQAKGAPKTGTPKQWKEWLDGAQRRGEFKQSERDWIGVDAWLDGREQTARKDLADFVRANEVQVSDVVLGEEKEAPIQARIDAINDEYSALIGDRAIADLSASEKVRIDELTEEHNTLADKAFEARNDFQPPKFAGYRTPGDGKNYRELLLTLPVRDGESRLAELEHARRNRGLSAEEWSELGALRQSSESGSLQDSVYRSSHWDQPNVIAHVRFDERTDSEGNRVLFLQELQSDWMQEGRKKGFASGKERSIADIDEELSRVQLERSAMIDAAAALPDSQMDEFKRMNRQIRQMADRMSELNREWDAVMKADKAVPNAPLKGTDEWATLAFKRMARWGAENNFDRIAWATGEQNADVFDLSKQVDQIRYAQNGDGNYDLEIDISTGGTRTNYDQSLDQVEAMVGKDIAEKISKWEGADGSKMESGVDGRRLSGVDLKLGGEGMKGFYDRILPAAVNKWAKPFGARTEMAEVAGSMQPTITITPKMREAALKGLPLFSKPDPNFSQSADYTFKESDYRSSVVSWAKENLDFTAPNGKPAWQNFVRWFGDSKVVDADGKPLVVYHGTAKGGFTEFDSDLSYAVPGFWFTDSGGYAEWMRTAKKGSRGPAPEASEVMPVFLRISNPKVFDVLKEGRKMAIEAGVARPKTAMQAQEILSGGYGWDRVVADIAEEAMSAGQDGLVIKNFHDNYPGGLTTAYLAFESTQIKSATGNTGSFDPATPDIRYSMPRSPSIAPAQQRAAQNRRDLEAGLGANPQQPSFVATDWFQSGVMGSMRNLKEAFQDKLAPVLYIQRDIQAAGRIIEEAADVHARENLMHGRVGNVLEMDERKYIAPLKSYMRSNKLSYQMLDDYLEARHAEERNEDVARKNQSMPDGGSGMTTEQANDFLNGTEAGLRSGKKLTPEMKRKMDRAAGYLDRLLAESRDRMLSNGLITQGEYDALKKYKHYVPLKNELDGREMGFGGARGSGIDARPAALRNALGRGAGNRAGDILAHALGDTQRLVVLGEKARVGRTLARLVLDNPNKDVWEIEPVILEQKLNTAGEVYMGLQNLQNDPLVMVIKFEGKPYKIKFGDNPVGRRLAASLKNLNNLDAKAYTTIFGGINRFYSKMMTSYSPAFMAVNMMRDLFYGTTGIGAEKGNKALRLAIKYYLPSMRAIFKDGRGSSTPNALVAKYLKEYSEAGGKTAFNEGKQAEDYQKDAERFMKGYFKLLAEGSPIEMMTKFVEENSVMKFIHDTNDAIENSLRLSAFIALRETGETVEKAATYAKNLTVNFNRKGSASTFMNATYLFFNAAVQGSHRTIMLLKNRKVQATMATLFSMQAGFAMILAGTDDDDGVSLADKIPDHVWQKSLVIPAPGSKAGYFTIPMPYGFNVFSYSGGRIAKETAGLMQGDEFKPMSVAGDISAAVMGSFSPINASMGMHTFIPTLPGQLVAQSRSNETSFGAPIRDKWMDDTQARAYQGKASTPVFYHMVAQALNAVGGGTTKEKPALGVVLDQAPEDIKFMVENIGGGPLRFLSQIFGYGESVAYGAETGIGDIPLVSAIIPKTDKGSATQRVYYDKTLPAIRNDEEIIKEAAARGEDWQNAPVNPEMEDSFKVARKKDGTRAKPPKGSLGPKLEPVRGSLPDIKRKVEKEVKRLRDEMRAIRNDPDMPQGKKKLAIDELNKEIASEMAILITEQRTQRREARNNRQ